MNTVHSLLVVWLIVVAAFDLGSRRVPNWLQAAGLVAALWALFADGQPFGVAPLQALLAAGLVSAFFLVFYALGWMGAADVKFAAVLGLWFGAETLLAIWLVASAIAMLHALLLMAARQLPRLPLQRPLPTATTPVDDAGAAPRGGRFSRARSMPYAAYLAAGALLAMQAGV